MQKFVSLFLLTTLASTTPLLTSEPEASQTANKTSKLQWTTNYQEAQELSKKSGKPLFLFFTGSDWCGWCKALDKEVLTSEAFSSLVGNTFIFMKIDFPIYTSLDDATKKQNEDLKEKFEIKGFPTIVLVSSEGHQMGILGYKAGGGKSYAEYLLKLVKNQDQFKQGMKTLQKQDLASLESLYKQASKMGMHTEEKAIIAAALQKGGSTFFLTESYRQFAHDGESNSEPAQNIKKKLQNQDPDNKTGVHYQIAVIDFEAQAENLPQQTDANSTIKPLQDYLQQFGANDSENRWRIEMTISQVLRSKNQNNEALAYAKSSLEHAPEEFKASVAQAIIGLEQNTSNIGSAEK